MSKKRESSAASDEAGVKLLVEDRADGQLLLYNESGASDYRASRPFRVNAGAVHAYVRPPANRTAYLAELRSSVTQRTVEEEILARLEEESAGRHFGHPLAKTIRQQ